MTNDNVSETNDIKTKYENEEKKLWNVNRNMRVCMCVKVCQSGDLNVSQKSEKKWQNNMWSKIGGNQNDK